MEIQNPARRDLADTPELGPDLLARVEAALDGLELFGNRGYRERVAYARQVVVEAERAGCDEVAALARMIAAGSAKFEPATAVALARKSLRSRQEGSPAN